MFYGFLWFSHFNPFQNRLGVSDVDMTPLVTGLYELAIRLAKQHLSAEEADELWQEWDQDTVFTYPLLFGMDQNHCHGSDLKIYVTWHGLAWLGMAWLGSMVLDL